MRYQIKRDNSFNPFVFSTRENEIHLTCRDWGEFDEAVARFRDSDECGLKFITVKSVIERIRKFRDISKSPEELKEMFIELLAA